MLTIRPAEARGHETHGWLDSYHTFSFADYYDPEQMGFRSLRVLNEDRVQGGQGFGRHSHRNFEIISYVLAGALQHDDSIGTGSVIRPGDVQRMSAGRGITHREFNASPSELVHFLQIWLMPNRQGLEPSYEQKHFAPEEKQGRLRLIASPNGDDESVTLHADARVYSGLLEAGQRAELGLAPERHAWVHVARGHVRVNGQDLKAGDGASLSSEPRVAVEGVAASEVLVFDLG